MKSQNRSVFLSCLAALAIMSGWSWQARADDYPVKPIRWIVPYPGGSTADIIARKLASVVTVKMGASIIVDNKPGASGIIGTAEVAKSPPNGYTLLYTVADPLIASSIMAASVPYDPLRDFTFLTKIQSSSGLFLIINPASTATSLKEFIDKARRGRVTYGSYGPGSFPQIIMEQFALEANVKFEEVAYRGPPPAIQDLIGNQISATFASVVNTKLAAKSGVRPIASVGKTRSPAFPDIPTFLELGFSSEVLQTPIWSGFFGPANLPRDVIKKNIEAFHSALRDPSMVKFGEDLAANFLTMSPEEFSAEFRREHAAVTALLRKLGLAVR